MFPLFSRSYNSEQICALSIVGPSQLYRHGGPASSVRHQLDAACILLLMFAYILETLMAILRERECVPTLNGTISNVGELVAKASNHGFSRDARLETADAIFFIARA